MGDILLYYRRPDPTTWVYLSSFLTLGLYFAFHRFWSIRNVDIILLILLAPGLLTVHAGRSQEFRAIQSDIAARAMRRDFQRQVPVSRQSESNALNTGFEAAAAVFSVTPIVALIHTGPVQDETLGTAVDEPLEEPAEPVEPAPTAEEGNVDVDASPPTAGEGDVDDSAAVMGEGSIEESTDQELDDNSDMISRENVDRERAFATQRLGFVSLFVIQGFILLRLLLDPLMVRRPLLEPNLTIGGLNFIGISLFIFMMANVLNSNSEIQFEQGPKLGPGYALMNMLPAIPTRPVDGVAPPTEGNKDPAKAKLALIAKVLAIIAHMAIVTGIVLIGSRHFGNLRAGVGCATLYLLLPYTAQMTGRVDHAIPAALLLWALLLYRKPFAAGIFLGLAGGLVYYPLFLLPLWFSFYWQKGARRFGIGVIAMLALLMLLLSFAGTDSLVEHLRRMFGLFSPYKEAHELSGFWAIGLNPIWRLPVIVGFVILSVFFAIWPAQKNLGVLISGSAAVMVAAQFWHGYGGGLYIAWFLPLLLLTIFRPNLQDRVATKVVDGPRVSPITRQTRLEVEAA